MKSTLLYLFVILSFISFSYAAIGVDVSQFSSANVTKTHWKCLAKHGVTFAVIESFHGASMENEHLAKCVKRARKGGMEFVDLSALFCLNCQGNEDIVRVTTNLITSIREQNIEFGRLWLSLYGCAGCWNLRDDNCAFMQKAASVFERMRVPIGIFTNSMDWQYLMGNCTGFSDLPLWYHHFDNVAAFSDRSYFSFSGWERPTMKQYWNTAPPKCDSGANMDFFPDRVQDVQINQQSVEVEIDVDEE